MSTVSKAMRSSRRGFLAGAAAGSATLLANAALATPSYARRYANNLKFSASGKVLNGFNDVITNIPLQLPPLPPTAEIWVDMALQDAADAVNVYVYVKIPMPPYAPIVSPVSLFEIGVEDVKLVDKVDALSGDSWTNFGMLGAVTRVEYTPFPDFLGYPASIGGRYRNSAFELLAGNVFGSHVTVVRYAAGEFSARLPYSAY